MRVPRFHSASLWIAGRGLAVITMVLTVAAASWAQEIATAAEAVGTVEVIRQGARIPVTIGTAIQTGDEVQTGKPGRAAFVFQDDSVLVIGDDSRIRIDDMQRDASSIRSIIQLLQGKARALVGEFYRTTNGTYEVHTPTALIGVQGTEFVIAYDPVAEVTDVVGVSGTVRVQSLADRAARGAVLVSPQELTTVAQGKQPTPPLFIPDARFRGYLDGLEFIGEGRSESLAAASVLAGRLVSPPEQAASYAAPFAVRGEPGDLPYEPRTPADVIDEPPIPEVYELGSVGVDF